MRPQSSLSFALVLIGLTFAAVPLASAQDTASRGAEKVVVIGFDGADPRLMDRYMSEGLLPNLKALKQDGTYAAILPPNPPQTPVSWASFSTGNLPGRTEIFDFLQREPGTYVPDFALATRERRTIGLGERNGLAAAAVVGAVAGVLLLVLMKLFRARWAWAIVVPLVAFGGLTFGLAGPLGNALPVEVPDATNNRKGKPFWTVAAEAGHRVGVVRVPVTFPAETLPAPSQMISGLGVPDMRGRVGTPSLWTSDPAFDPGNNQFSLEITKLPGKRGLMEADVVGPFDYPFHIYVLDRAEEEWKEQGLSRADRRAKREELAAKLTEEGSPQRIDLPLLLDVGDESVTWKVGENQGTLAPGEWSEFVTLDFPVNWLVDMAQPLRGMVRFKLISLEPELNFYMSPINFHPQTHPVPYTWPPDLAEKISEEIGLFKTQGWAIDTWSYPTNRLGGIDLFLEDMDFTVEGYRKLLHHMLDEEDFDLYVQIFYFTDRAGHMLWYNIDPGHPLYEPENAQRFEQAMRDVYKRMDDLVGEVRAKLDEEKTLFIVLSDHGFSSFRRQINYNTWLYQEGYLALKGHSQSKTLQQLFDKDVENVNVFSGIDWSRTKAWAMGLGTIYVNLVGREPQGIVMPGEEYDELVAEIQEGLESLVDPETGEKPIFRVYTRDEIYTDYDPDKVPDLRPSNILNYRVSWQDALGGLSDTVFENNDRVWSGDHCSLEPSVLKGVLFLNRKLDTDEPRIIDMAPSILNELGLEPDTDLDGSVIWQRGAR